MRRRIENPRILLLDCPLEYKKGESQTNVEIMNEVCMYVCMYVCILFYVRVYQFKSDETYVYTVCLYWRIKNNNFKKYKLLNTYMCYILCMYVCIFYL